MHKLGISVYPDLENFPDIQNYLALAARYGCSRVFSSMFQLQGSREEVMKYFRDFIDEAHKYGMEVSLDVNPEFLEQIGVSPSDISAFHEIGCDIIRMDGSYHDGRDIDLINNPYGIKIEFNTSMADNQIAQLLNDGAQMDRITTCHNFYPQPLTGMEWEKFKNINRAIKQKANIPIAAFVSSNAPVTHGVWDAQYGLCTVEKMRNYPIDLQARLLLATDDVDDILIGNAFATEEEFAALADVLKEREAPDFPASSYLNTEKITSPKKVKVVLDEQITDAEKEILLDFPAHVDMGDSSEWIWRSRLPRMFYQDREFKPRIKENLEAGDVIIVNDNYKHYAGEVQIIKIPVKNDGMRNVVAKIEGAELDMLELLKDGDFVEFTESKS